MAKAATPRVKGVDAIYYRVHDLERATAFYNELLGMEPTGPMPGFGMEYTLPNGESFGIIKIPETMTAEYGAYWRGGSGVMFAVDDIAAAAAAAKARGVKLHDDGKIAETRVCYMVFGEDPEGNSFILHQRK
jgi:predicted enzyme related to lactoylglutathione lyase